jgi:glycosyltransferase involved in cell wall biosynthesis
MSTAVLRSDPGERQPVAEIDPGPRTLMLGLGWFPEKLGGLDRYYRDLLEHLPEASGVVIGASPNVPARVRAVATHDDPLPKRLAAFWRAAQAAADRTDVVDAHFALYALAPLLVGRLRRKPVVVHYHGPWADESLAAGDRSGLKHAVRRALESLAYRRADRAVVLSSAFRQALVERYRVQPWRIDVVPPGVDLERFSVGSAAEARTRLGVGADAFVAVAVRRLVPRMGLEVLLEAWSCAVPDLPPGSVLLIAGDGDLRESLARRAPSEVRILGRVTDEQLVDLYRAADVAVVPTLHHEGFGLVVIEAAACGTPSIVTATGGLPEAIAGLDESLVVAPGDAGALSARLLRAVDDRPSRAAARAYAERFDWRAVAERHREIGRSAISGAGSGRLKVVYLGHVAQLSGAEIALLRLLPHLERVDPHVVLAEDGPLLGALHLAGISAEVLPMADAARTLRKGNVRGGGVQVAVAGATAAYIARLAVRLRALKPDIVHTNTMKAGVYGSVAARLAGVPVVWHVRDRIADDYLPGPAVTAVRGMVRRLATAVVANSSMTMETVPVPAGTPSLVLPEVMDRPAFARSPREPGPLRYGIVGRIAPWKGQDLFLRSFASAFGAGDERAVVVGGALFGEDDYAESLPGLIASLGLEQRVELLGHRRDVWAELSRLDVLVHASLSPEPFGQVILEGMTAGVPVIAAGAGGPSEIIRNDETGLLYEPRSADALAAAMRRMRDPELRSRLAGAAREGLDRYSPPVVAGQLHELYSTVVAAT